MQAGAVYRFTLYAGGNQALSRKSAFKLNKHNKNTNKWRHNKEGGRPHRHVARCYVAWQSGRRGGEGIVYDADDDSSHNFTGRQSESLCEWNEWIPAAAGWRRMWVPVRVLSILSTSGRYSPSPPPPNSFLWILNIWHERKGTGWGRLRLRLRFYTLLLPLSTPARPEYQKGCLCCGIPIHSVWKRRGEREGGSE